MLMVSNCWRVRTAVLCHCADAVVACVCSVKKDYGLEKHCLHCHLLLMRVALEEGRTLHTSNNIWFHLCYIALSYSRQKCAGIYPINLRVSVHLHHIQWDTAFQIFWLIIILNQEHHVMIIRQQDYFIFNNSSPIIEMQIFSFMSLRKNCLLALNKTSN
jgi:hypothetical protein